MDSTVHTGFTKASHDVSLVSQSFLSEEKERAFLLLQIHAEPRDAKALEEECISIVKHALLQTEGEAWHRLDGTLKELNGLFKGFLISHAVQDVHAIVSISDKEGNLHVSHAGRGEAYLIRNGGCSQITEYVRGKPSPMFVHIASGSLEAGDVLIFSTQRLLRTLTPAQLAQMSPRESHLVHDIIATLETEKEMASVGTLHLSAKRAAVSRFAEDEDLDEAPVRSRSAYRELPSRRRTQGGGSWSIPSFDTVREYVMPVVAGVGKLSKQGASLSKKGMGSASSGMQWVQVVQDRFTLFLADLRHPERKKRAHLLLLAGALAAFLIIWMTVRLATSTQRSKSRAELGELMQQIEADIRTAENRRLTGDSEGANAILDRAELQSKEIINNDSGLFRSEALNLLDRVQAKKEEINNVVRISPRMLVNLSTKEPDIAAQGMIGIADGEFTVFDKKNSYHVVLNSVEEGRAISEEDLIADGANFPRYAAQAFLTSGNSLVEVKEGILESMKTDDANGWVTGKDLETYLRNLYVLSSDNKIYKYERLNNRYSSSVLYNVNGDLSGALDMAIDGNVYVLKDNGTVVKLLRGEAQTFGIHHAPSNLLTDAAKLYKLPDGNFYFLDPVKNRVIVTSDGGSAGDSSYVRQYVIEGDQIGKLQDLYVDPEESHIYVMDEKKVYVVDIIR